ncbi:MAG: hypothetical protein K0S58_3020 [Nitrospira sp.]|nr:hypothetical protein [Nitrospira sp.]
MTHNGSYKFLSDWLFKELRHFEAYQLRRFAAVRGRWLG